MNKIKALARSPYLTLLFIAAACCSCVRNDALIDTHTPISGHRWSYLNKVQIPFEIADTSKTYNIYVNLRHTPEYKYSNIFLKIYIISPDRRKTVERREFRLALPDGEWLGKGSGNMYSYQLPYKAGYRFPGKGKYFIVLEQNMRDNPLREVTDAGIRLEVAK